VGFDECPQRTYARTRSSSPDRCFDLAGAEQPLAVTLDECALKVA